MSKNTLTITDNRTGKNYELPITDGTIRTVDLRQIKAGDEDFGLMGYDPAYLNTASCRSAITLIDGDKGILRYRGYPIEQLAETSSYLEVAYLLFHGELPDQTQLANWIEQITTHTFVHENVKTVIEGFRYDAHPMGMFLATIGALSTFYPEAKHVHDKNIRMLNVVRLLAKVPTIAAWSFRHSQGFPFVYPDNGLSFAGNFLAMMKRMSESRYKPNPVLERALDVLFILHADHEQNCSTSVMRSTGSSQVDPYSAVAAASAALYGPLHGGANEAVLRMLAGILTPDAGEVRVCGYDMHASPLEAKRRIGFLSGDTQLYMRLTPREVKTIISGAVAHLKLVHNQQAALHWGLALSSTYPPEKSSQFPKLAGFLLGDRRKRPAAGDWEASFRSFSAWVQSTGS